MELNRLKEEQISLSKRIKLQDKLPIDSVRYVAGIDLTYLDVWKTRTLGIACAVVLDIKRDFEVVQVEYAESEVDFPYIPTFLAYRELPLVMRVSDKLGVRVDLFMLDGMGIMHPRRMGIAAHFGVIKGCMSVGCAKSHLIGEYKKPSNRLLSYEKVFINGEHVGFVLKSKKNANPIFISPGNNISLDSSLKMAIRCLNGYKLPEPTRLAHNLLQVYRRKLIG